MNIHETLFERAKKVTPGGVHSPVRSFKSVGGTPFFVKKAKGQFIFGEDDQKLLDFCQSWGPLPFGHAHPRILEAVHLAIENGTSFGTAETKSLELAERITNEIPFVESVRFVNSGTEAVASAVRLARGASGRNKILKFNGCYHGHVDSLMVKAGSGLATEGDSLGLPKGVIEDTVVANLDDDSSLDLIDSTFACVIIEPIPANYGLLPQRIEFLKKLRKKTQEQKVILIFDEVISGFRMSMQGSYGIYEIVPDLVTYGKIIGGGFPVGAYGGKKSIMDFVSPSGGVYQAGTLSGNPVAMSAGISTFDLLIEEKPWKSLELETRFLTDELNKVSLNFESEFYTQCLGSLFWVTSSTTKEIIRSPKQFHPNASKNFSVLFHKMLNKGIYLAPSGFEVGFLSTAHTRKDLQFVIDSFEEILRETKL